MNYKKVFFLLLLLIKFLSISFGFEQIGIASWYGPNFHGKKTANGEIFNTYDLTAAHKTLPFNSIVKIISLENSKEVVVRINDRGPFAKDRIIDLSKKAASSLDLLKHGTMKVKIEVLKKGDNKYYKYVKYHNKRYIIQLGSFTNINSAHKLKEKLAENNISIVIKKVFIKKKYYYRVLTTEMNYFDLQKCKTWLHSQKINNYLVKNITK